MLYSSSTQHYGLAIDIGGTKVAFALFNQRGDVIFEKRILQQDIGQDSPNNAIAQTARELVINEGQHPLSVIVLGAPGSPKDAISFTPNTPGFSFPACLHALGEALHCPNVIGLNDVKAAALGEQAWGGWRVSSLLHLNLGTGFAAGAVINGQLLRGAHDLALEIGYLIPIHHELSERGAAHGFAPTEALLSGAGLAQLANDAMNKEELTGSEGQSPLSAHDVLRAKAGPLFAIRERFVEELASVTANMATVLDPEIITLGGGLGAACESLLPRITQRIATFTPQPVPVRIATFAHQAGLLGAIARGLQELGTELTPQPPHLRQE